jgi:hypothetical protein
MINKSDIDALFDRALTLEADASTLTDRAEAARVALAYASRAKSKRERDAFLAKAQESFDQIEPALAHVVAAAAALAAEKKK